IGFTGGTGGNTVKQDITNFTYTYTGPIAQPAVYINNVVVPASTTGTTNIVATTTYPTITMGSLTQATDATLNVTGSVTTSSTTGFGGTGVGWTLNQVN